MSSSKKGRVTGIGGIFFKSEDPKKQRQWYADHLGLAVNDYGSTFEFREGAAPHNKAYLQWSPFAADTKYFDPSQKQFMINYRVENMEALLEELKAAGVTICDEVAEYDYGKFVHILDPEGNKIELWEPIDSGLDDGGKTTK